MFQQATLDKVSILKAPVSWRKQTPRRSNEPYSVVNQNFEGKKPSSASVCKCFLKAKEWWDILLLYGLFTKHTKLAFKRNYILFYKGKRPLVEQLTVSTYWRVEAMFRWNVCFHLNIIYIYIWILYII